MTRINVTRSDIVRGSRNSTTACPVARAMRRRKGFTEVYVDSAAFSRVGDLDEYDFPVEVTKFIHRFDRGDSVMPFSFEIEVPA